MKSSRSSKGTDTSPNTTSSSGSTTPTAARKRKGRDPSINAAFFKVDGATPPTPLEGEDAAEGGGWVVGEVTDHAIDLHDVRPVSTIREEAGREGKGLLLIALCEECWWRHTSFGPHSFPSCPINRARPSTFLTS